MKVIGITRLSVPNVEVRQCRVLRRNEKCKRPGHPTSFRLEFGFFRYRSRSLRNFSVDKGIIEKHGHGLAANNGCLRLARALNVFPHDL